MSFTNYKLWDIQIDLNEGFLDLFDILAARVGLLCLTTIIIFIWLGILTWYIIKHRKVE